MSAKQWTEPELAVLRKHYPDTPTNVIADALGRPIDQVYRKAHNLALKKSEDFMKGPHSGRLRQGDKAGRATQFTKGQTPWNKGVPGSAGLHPNSKRTQFKKGQMSGAAQHNYVPIGSTRISKDGILERKITDDPSVYPARRWAPVARLVWEAAHGPIPPKHVVRFKPGMTTTLEDEITVDKLECISKAENMRRNSIHTYPKEIAAAVLTRGALIRKINHVEKHSRSA